MDLTKSTQCYNIVSTMIQKIIRVGNSVAVTIPKKILEEKNLKVGQQADVDIQPVKKTKAKITPEFIEWVDKYIENNRPALEELANK